MIMVELREITKDNFEDVLKLTVFESQENFVSSTAYSLAQAWAYKETAFPFSIYADKALEPYNFLQTDQQIAEKAKDIYLLMEDEQIIGSVACYGNEIDDLIVSRKFQHQGYGKQLLLWGMQHIRQSNSNPITLHVAEWNQEALKLYQDIGFEITNIEKIR